MRNMRVKKRFYDLIATGEKNLEVRVGYNNITKIQVGERINLQTHSESMVIEVVGVRVYTTFGEMLEAEDSERIAPGMKSSDLLDLLRKFYPPAKEKLGVYVLEIKQVGS